MQHDTLGSEHESDQTLMTDEQPLTPTASEHCFLADEAADAKMALFRSARDLRDTLAGLVDIRSCAGHHPWIATGSAVAMGAVAGVVMGSSRRRRIRRRRKMALPVEATGSPSDRAPETPHAARAVLLSLTGTVLAAVLPPLFQSWFAPAGAASGETLGDQPPAHDSANALGDQGRVQ